MIGRLHFHIKFEEKLYCLVFSLLAYKYIVLLHTISASFTLILQRTLKYQYGFEVICKIFIDETIFFETIVTLTERYDLLHIREAVNFILF
jgi:hypothetical protein